MLPIQGGYVLKFFWYQRPYNYGDLMTPYICQWMEIPCQFSTKEKCEAIMVGSIAKVARAGVKVLGSGFIRAADPVCRDADYRWVRGQRSRQMVIKAGGKCPEIYGDAALIFPDFIKPSEKVHDVGYIPHHVEYRSFRKRGFVIDLNNPDVIGVTRQITSCRKIISSSLHGLVIAHAYGIPAAWVKLSDKLCGDGMKFHDHYESIGLKAVQSTIENPVFQVPTNYDPSEIKKILCSL